MTPNQGQINPVQALSFSFFLRPLWLYQLLGLPSEKNQLSPNIKIPCTKTQLAAIATHSYQFNKSQAFAIKMTDVPSFLKVHYVVVWSCTLQLLLVKYTDRKQQNITTTIQNGGPVWVCFINITNKCMQTGR